jgi:hypothetical protein
MDAVSLKLSCPGHFLNPKVETALMHFLLAIAGVILIGGYLWAPFLRPIRRQIESADIRAETEVQMKAASIQAPASSSAASQWSKARP